MKRLSYVYQYIIYTAFMAIVFGVLDIIFNSDPAPIEFICFLSFVLMWCTDRDNNRPKT